MTEKFKSNIVLLIIVVGLFGGTYLWRSCRDRDISENSKYTFGRITKKTGSLKNGNHWHYVFEFEGRTYTDYRSTHVDYDVSIGDYFLVQFSSKSPKHSKILYQYKLKETNHFFGKTWDTIPYSLISFKDKK